jgi:hypothetical protein
MSGEKRANRIAVRTRIEGRRIHSEYDIAGPWRDAFNVDGIAGWFAEVGGGVHDFFVEYEDDVSSVPPGIAVVPLLCSLLPIAWLHDAEVSAPELDEQFLDSVKHVRNAYAAQYPEFAFGGVLTAERVVANSIGRPRSGPLILFSGGVDAVFSALGNRAVTPTLATVWGADLFFKQREAWTRVRAQNQALAESLGLGFTTIAASFRLFLNSAVLNPRFGQPVGDNWWHGFQYGIGLLGLAAPLAWVRGADHVMISSSYSAGDPAVTRCASDPVIDSALRFGGVSCRHYDFTVTRQQKLAFICAEARRLGRGIPLRVCWEAGSGRNCCLCEKCMRTIFGIYAEDADPNEFGFALTDDVVNAITKKLGGGGLKDSAFLAAIVAKLRARKTRWTDTPQVAALLAAFARLDAAAQAADP